MLTLTQIILTVFLLFAVSRVILRFKGGAVSARGFIFWVSLFGFAIVAVFFPKLTGELAKTAGIGRGVDAIIYASLVLLFYLIFRLHIFIEDLRQEITALVRKLALQELKKNAKKTSKD